MAKPLVALIRDTRSGQWLKVRFRTSLYSPLARPIIRLRGKDTTSEHMMPAALFGSGEWIGWAPTGTREIILIGDANDHRASLELVSYESVAAYRVILRALRRNMRQAFVAFWTRFLRGKADARAELARAITETPFERYHEWRQANLRPCDPRGLEAPRDSWSRGPHFRFVLVTPPADARSAASALLDVLRRQPYPHWSVADVPASASWTDLVPGDVIVPFVAGDFLAEHALGAVAEYIQAHPDVDLIYADEDSIDAAGRYVEPELKPDWSPIFQRSRSYVGRAVYFRVSALAELPGLSGADLQDPAALWNALSPEKKVVGHVRRVLLTKPAVSAKPAPAPRIGISGPAGAPVAAPYASVIIPVKDRPDLLSACIASLRETAPSGFEAIIVDNGSEQRETLAIFDSLKADPRFHVLSAPGPFNFSALCNRAAAASRSPILAFLNSDTVPKRADWLATLVDWAMRPEVGAVGARLLYPSGRLQHAGLVIGLGGHAAHIEAGAPGDEAGYLRRLTVPHEISAVTAACLVVEKAKFDAVAGFDAEAFPVELGDVDLCLRLAAQGWKTLLVPDVTLVHHESATRGRTRHRDARYEGERQRFAARWNQAIQDDPYFHPALSLTSLRTMLEQ